MSDIQDLMGSGIAPQEPAPVKRTLSPEHKAALQAGREAAKSRGRPASRVGTVAMPPEQTNAVDIQVDELERAIEAAGDGGRHLTRESRGDHDTTFDVPMTGRRSGWDYTYWPFKVNGQEVDSSEITSLQQGGWLPVPKSHFPSLVPPDWAKPTIERHGCRLYMRPMRLTEQAREEASNVARRQVSDKLAQAAAGDSGRQFAARDSRAHTGAGPIDASIRPLI